MAAMGSSVCRTYHTRWTMLVLCFAPTVEARAFWGHLSTLVLEFKNSTSLPRAGQHYPDSVTSSDRVGDASLPGLGSVYPRMACLLYLIIFHM
jgi:hypothetical protein